MSGTFQRTIDIYVEKFETCMRTKSVWGTKELLSIHRSCLTESLLEAVTEEQEEKNARSRLEQPS